MNGQPSYSSTTNTAGTFTGNVWANVTYKQAVGNAPPPKREPPEDGEAGALAILGIPPGLPPDAIRKAFREKLKTAHPDLGGSDEAARRVIDAYRRLCPEDVAA